MEKCDQPGQLAEAIIAFDTLYTTNHMQMLKLLFPYLDIESRHKLAMFIKWQELLYTMNFTRQYSGLCRKTNYPGKKELDISALLPLLSPYCSEQEKNMLSQFSQMQNMMQTYKDMAQYLPMIQEIMGAFSVGENNSCGEGSSHSGNGGAGINSMMDMLKNVMTPEQQNMFSLFMEGGKL
ncbi:MAG: hypothetical protein MSS92_10640 [Lachnospiraceae bacterium]|nr:hypothetical protein [Lachnospiraceae bacterium]MCI7596655.1 hypothetical protein [Lachnospiraceae bacterium]MDY3224056.1 hypothetical protein [Lachnospiraceae bacterium]MDY4096188.1 hypothetical protein [Lachnospiraceae bacterium]